MTPALAERMRAADAAMRAGRGAEARGHWEAVIAAAPAEPVALNGLGMIAMREGRAVEAAALFRRAAEADPGVPVLWLNHAGAARAAGDAAGEKASLIRVREMEPLALPAHVRLAELAERTGDAAEARAAWTAIVAIAERMGGQVPPEAQPAVAHARAALARETAALAERIDAALAERRAATAPGERRRVDAAIDHALGRRPIYINECSGLHVPFLPADEYFDRALFAWLPDLEAETAAIREELAAALAAGREGFAPYVALPAGTPANVWSGLDGSMDWSTLHLWRHGRRDEAACARFPRTAAALDRVPLAALPGRMPTVFFSALAPRAHIPPHTGVTNSRAIVHLPLIVPEGCRFRVGAETRAWVEGEAIAFDDTIEHEAWNDSDSTRVVLILDVWNPHLSAAEQAMIAAFYAADADRAPA